MPTLKAALSISLVAIGTYASVGSVLATVLMTVLLGMMWLLVRDRAAH